MNREVDQAMLQDKFLWWGSFGWEDHVPQRFTLTAFTTPLTPADVASSHKATRQSNWRPF
jgi:hypothetical protein